MSSVTADFLPPPPARRAVGTAFLTRRFAENYFSTLAFLWLSYWFVTRLSDFHRGILQGQWQLGMFGIDGVITVHPVFIALLVLYAVVLIPYYAVHPWMHSKSFVFLRGRGFKASNLTNRGIVTHGPYAFVRHPAYIAKNIAWWLGALPGLLMLLSMHDYRGVALAVLALCGWTVIYALRAITEERHLLMGKNGYAEYAQRVRWRFIPGVV